MGITPAFAQSEISGIVYSPTKKNVFFEDVISEDISTISSFTDSVRLYKIEDSTQKILENAKLNNIKIVLGVDLGSGESKIKDDLQKVVQFVQDYPETVDSVVVGNDAIAQKQITIDKLQEYLTFFKINGITVSSANSPYIWQDNPSLVDEVNYILLYSFDFWEGLDAEQAARNAILQYNNLQKSFPGKSIILETGWPSDGGYIGDAIPTEQEQSNYLKRFVNLANQKNISYYIFAYADESWKPAKNGNDAEGNWGMLFEERVLKPHLVGMVGSETVKHSVVIDESGQAHYTPAATRYEGDRVMKVYIPDDVSTISYKISGQEKQISTDGKKTVLFVQGSHGQDIMITTDQYSRNLEFSLIPQAFASCDVDAVCYSVSPGFFAFKEITVSTPMGNLVLAVPADDVILLAIFTSILFGIISYIFSICHHRRKEWDSVSIKLVNGS